MSIRIIITGGTFDKQYDEIRGSLTFKDSHLPEILKSVIGPNEIHLYCNPEGEHDDFLKCVKSRKDPYFPVDVGHRVSTVCHIANISIRLGRKLKWDPKAERFEHDDEANQMLSRPMRKPWTLS